jgi:transposase-like protein
VNNVNKETPQKHTAEFKAEALKLADKIGVAATARELNSTNLSYTTGALPQRKAYHQ